jgi:uroporphyrinogen-III decarboxylase
MKSFADGLMQLRETFRFDGILVSLHGHSDEWKNGLLKTEKIDDSKTILHYEDRTETHSGIDLPVIQFLKPQPVKDVEAIDIDRDVPDEIDYIPVSGNLYFRLDRNNLYNIFDYFHEHVGEQFSIHGEITSPFDYFLDFLGYQNALMALVLEPEKCKKILARFAIGVKNIAVGMCQKNIDAIKISSPFAGMGFISPEFYEEFVLPYEREIIAAIRSCGKHVYIHTCGHIGDRLELMCKSGASGLECLDPKPVGNVDLADAFRRIGDQMFIKGNIDSVNTLLADDDERVRKDVLKIIETGKTKGKGFILSTACSIAPLVKKERILMLSDLISENGKNSG